MNEVMVDNSFSPKDILCLQYAGSKPSQIMTFGLAPEEYAEAFEAYIDKAENIMSMQKEHGIITLTFQDGRFPLQLKEIGNDCPPIIHCLGNMSLLAPTASRIAVIGARAASPTGLKKAYELGKQFAEEGYIIVSGLALGCDMAAHEGCLDAGGRTIAIVASGLDIVHPKENAPLQQRILENGGLILSEHPFGVKANPTRLIARNRLQAALSSTVILAECPQKSGSMHTMRFARKYHKCCLVVSYPEYNDKSAGNELLINLNFARSI